MRLRIFLLIIANILAVAAVLFMFNFFNIIDFSDYLNKYLGGKEKQRIEDLYLLEKEELSKMQEALVKRDTDLQMREDAIREQEDKVKTDIEQIEEDKGKLASAWTKFTNEINEHRDREATIREQAQSWSGRPPAQTVALMEELLKNNKEIEVVETLMAMDTLAQEQGQNSITPYLSTLLTEKNPTLARKLFETRRNMTESGTELLPEEREPELDAIDTSDDLDTIDAPETTTPGAE